MAKLNTAHLKDINPQPDHSHVKPGSLGFALFRDSLAGGHGPDPIDNPTAHKESKKPLQKDN